MHLAIYNPSVQKVLQIDFISTSK